MSAPDKTGSQYKNSEQVILNDTRDDKYGVIAVEIVAENEAGTALLRPQTDGSGQLLSNKKNFATIADDVTTTNVIYVGYAPIGSATSSAVWRIKKINTASYPITTWADSNDNFDNIFDDRTSLTYG